MDAAKGSIWQRGTNLFELRVYGGTDPLSGKRRWVTRTVRGDRLDATRDLIPDRRRRRRQSPSVIHDREKRNFQLDSVVAFR